MIDQTTYHFLDTLFGTGAVKGACLNVGLGEGRSARLMLVSRLVTRVSSLENTQATIDAYRARWPANEPLEVRHTIVLGDAAAPAPGVVQALNPPFDFILVDTITEFSDNVYQALRNIMNGAKNGLLKAGGFVIIEFQGDGGVDQGTLERDFKIWLTTDWLKTSTRPALAPSGSGRSAEIVLYKLKP